jgi:asparaginyl-tRNA synthetase
MEMTDTSKMRRTEIADILKNPSIGEEVLVKGWVRAFRNNRFVALNDGSSFNNLQVVLDSDNMNQEILKSVSFHACIAVTGKLVESTGSGQTVEIQAEGVEMNILCNPRNKRWNSFVRMLNSECEQIRLALFLEFDMP